MRKPTTSSKLAGTAAALLAVWLCAGHPARAGDGGADLGSLQNFINDICAYFGMTTCPQTPTLTQAVLQLAAFVDIAPEAVRSSTAFNVPVGPNVDAGNPSRPPGINCSVSPCTDPLNPISGLPIDPGVLSSLRPLAFIGASTSAGAATPTQLYDPSASAFLYAVGGSSTKGASQPDTLVLFYDDPTRTKSLAPGQVAAKISLPLTVLNNDGTERSFSATLQYKVPAAGVAPCSASTVTGNFLGNGNQTRAASMAGVNCAMVFAKSPVSSGFSHAIFEVSLPMLITTGNDPAIIAGDPAIPGANPFFGDPGFTPTSNILGPNAKAIGIGPNAAPAPAAQCVVDPNTGVCTYRAAAPPSSGTYALCASLPTDTGGNTLLPSVGAFYAIGGDGVVRLSAPLAPAISIGCPAM